MIDCESVIKESAIRFSFVEIIKVLFVENFQHSSRK